MLPPRYHQEGETCNLMPTLSTTSTLRLPPRERLSWRSPHYTVLYYVGLGIRGADCQHRFPRKPDEIRVLGIMTRNVGCLRPSYGSTSPLW